MADKKTAYESVLAATFPVLSALHALDTDPSAGQGYHIEKLVAECRRLAAVVNAQIGSVPPVGPGPA